MKVVRPAEIFQCDNGDRCNHQTYISQDSLNHPKGPMESIDLIGWYVLPEQTAREDIPVLKREYHFCSAHCVADWVSWNIDVVNIDKAGRRHVDDLSSIFDPE